MLFLRRLHLYLGCLFAPMLIFFALTGACQVFYWHESEKGPGGYRAPYVLVWLSDIHKEAHIPPTKRDIATPLRYFMVIGAAGLVLTSAVGVIMAYRFSRQPTVATACLLLGIGLPVALLWIYH